MVSVQGQGKGMRRRPHLEWRADGLAVSSVNEEARSVVLVTTYANDRAGVVDWGELQKEGQSQPRLEWDAMEDE